MKGNQEQHQTEIFHSVLTRLVQTLEFPINQAMTEFETAQLNHPEKPQNILITELFHHFPRSIPQYTSVIKSLVALSAANPPLMLKYLSTEFEKQLSNTQELQSFINQNSLEIHQENKILREIIFGFRILFYTDLICSILATFEPIDASGPLANTGYVLCSQKQFRPDPVYHKVLKQWAVIFSIISDTDFETTISQFSDFIGKNIIIPVFTILQFIRLDINEGEKVDQFKSDVVQTIKSLLKKHLLTPEILCCVSNMIMSVQEDSDFVMQLFEIAWSTRTVTHLKSGSYELVAAALQKEPKLQPKQQQFYRQRVYAHCGDPKKVERSLRFFQRLLISDRADLQWTCWQWSAEPKFSNLYFLRFSPQCKDPQSEDSFINVFMRHFFTKSDFSLCPKLFSDVLVQLASMNFSFFIQNIASQFLELPPEDSRFIVFLMTIIRFNNEEFGQVELVSQLNAKIQPLLIKQVQMIPLSEEQCICINEISKIEDNDNLVETILKLDWDIDIFGPLTIPFKRSDMSTSSFQLSAQLLRALKVCVSIESMKSTHFINHIVKLSLHPDSTIAIAALAICRQKFVHEMLQSRFLKILVSKLSSLADPEANMIYLSLLCHVLVQMKEVHQDLYYEIETISMMSLTSEYPPIRQIAWRLLQVCSDGLNGRGLYALFHSQLNQIAYVAKKQIIQQVLLIPSGSQIAQPNVIGLQTVLTSHFYDLWLVFLQQLANITVAANYSPFLTRMQQSAKLFQTSDPSIRLIGLLILYFASNSYFDGTARPAELYKIEPFNPAHPTEDKRNQACQILWKMIGDNQENWSIQRTLSVIEHIHPSYIPLMIALLSSVPSNQLPDSAHTLTILLQDPVVTKDFLHSSIPLLLSFIQVLTGYLFALGINGPRLMDWTAESEDKLKKFQPVVCDICYICTRVFELFSGQTTESIWPIGNREVAFRLFVNWATTQSPQLAKIREVSRIALATIVQVGPVLIDCLWLDGFMDLFVSIEQERPFLSFLLYFHTEELLGSFISSCFTHNRKQADLFFESIFMAFNVEQQEFLQQQSGPLLLLGIVYKQLEHPRISDYFHALFDLICRMSSSDSREHIIDELSTSQISPRHFAYATEHLLHEAFKYLRNKSLMISVRDIVEALRPWFLILRLLPKQTSLMPGTPTSHHRFTPYQFLEQLMKATEYYKNNENFVHLVQIWIDLLQSPEHAELIPLFLSEWQSADIKKQLFKILLVSHPTSIVKRLALHCSFAYYYHVTSCLGRKFESDDDGNGELWILPLLEEGFKKGSTELVQFIPSVVHFAFLFAEKGARGFFENLCHQFNIDIPDGQLTNDVLLATVRLFVSKLEQSSEKYLEFWGKEALRWLFGCQSLEFASMSLMIFNQIMRPITPLVIDGVCKSVTFQLVNSPDDERLHKLVGESFKFYNAVFEKNALFAFQYASAFLDCRKFVDNSLFGAAQLFIKSLSNPATNTQAWNQIIQIIRPLLPKLESDEQVQKIFDLLIKTSTAEELMMIVVPLKSIHPNMFSSSYPVDQLLRAVGETSLFKALEHYATMIETASPALADSIFNICSIIVMRVVNENNRNSLTKLYKVALNNITTCPNAIQFISIIAQRDPQVSANSVLEFYNWDRSDDDVIRRLANLLTTDPGYSTITDCSSLESVYNLLNSDVVPKILPFAAQQEMIQGMKSVVKQTRQKRSQSIRRWSHGPTPYSATDRTSGVGISLLNSGADDEYEKLNDPTEIVEDESVFEMTPILYRGLIISDQEFLQGLRMHANFG